MGALVFVCPATGLEVSTGLEMDHDTFAALPSVLPDVSCPHCPKPHQLSEVTAWLAEGRVELMGPPQARLPLPKIKVFAENLGAAYIPSMPPSSTSETCAHPNVVIDAWGERLCGCAVAAAIAYRFRLTVASLTALRWQLFNVRSDGSVRRIA